MESFRDSLVVLLLGMSLFFLQQAGLFSFFGVRMNSILVFFAFLSVARRNFFEYSFFILLFFLFFFLDTTVWITEISFLSLVFFSLFFLRNYLPGKFFFNFFLLVVSGTFFSFYGMPIWKQLFAHGFSFVDFSFLPTSIFFTELFLNTICVLLFSFFGSRRIFSRLFRET